MQWRLLPNEYGKWKSAFRLYRHWIETGVFDDMLETLAEIVPPDISAGMIDNTVIQAHHCAFVIKRGDEEDEGSGRSRGGFYHQASRPLRRALRSILLGWRTWLIES